MKYYVLIRKPNSILGLLLLSLVIITCWHNQSHGQITNPNNNPFVGAFVGYNGAQDLDFRTNNILRLQLMETQTNTINGFTNVDQDGFLGLSTEPNFFGGVGPFSMLHLNGLTPTPLIAGPPLSNSLTL